MDDQLPNIKNTGMIAGGICISLVLLIILQHNLSFKSTIVLPAGGTYLGPTESPAPVSVTSAPLPPTPASSQGKFTVGKDAAWVTIKGNKYPYAFRAPKSLNLVALSKDVYDIYAISWNNMSPDSNVLIGVDDLRRTDALKKYIGISKRQYVEEWWKQFGSLKGVQSITEFTNSKGVKGYRAKYLNAPNDDVFFEIPAAPHFVIHMANGVLDTSVFDEITDSVEWTQ
jgi:hypothetical protein